VQADVDQSVLARATEEASGERRFQQLRQAGEYVDAHVTPFCGR
jgi:hypothetical protein